MNQIIVGVDGSEQSLAATRWAADEARRRNAALRVVYVVTPWLFDVPVDPRAGAVRAWLLKGGEEIVDRAVAAARENAPGAEVTGVQKGGHATEVLIDEARDALMLVAGTRGTGTLAGLALGSVSLQIASHARRPTVIVREVAPQESGPASGGGIVVGVDGSPGSAAALGFAFEEAAARGAGVRAVLAWTHPASAAPEELRPSAFDAEALAGEHERVLAEALAGWRERFPDVSVEREVVHQRTVRALADASAGADLLVVGSRGRGGFAGLLLGSVGRAMLHRAHCPVAVVPAPGG
ncbi:universal stress protein [Actinomadura graeca]|uniref:Universal stress protein n=1 Tax=Actinomadura graeca TaxID=2750812 RepID=A0ABX8QVI7_9ACTN|nr:universal stress protein [Actinomadura graeca]QXJ22638.1 universal stress protein [Actinomadura graeca]